MFWAEIANIVGVWYISSSEAITAIFIEYFAF